MNFWFSQCTLGWIEKLRSSQGWCTRLRWSCLIFFLLLCTSVGLGSRFNKMYFYISFLRAPPIHSRPTSSTPLPIKVQITNDLRTEFYDKDTDLYYAWTQIPVVPGTPPTSTPFTKLTTWRQSNTYTELKVYPPKDVKEGQKWQLVLCAPGTSRGQGVLSAIDLTTNDMLTNTRPFPVLSLPVLFCSKPHGSGVQGTKQEAIERILKLPPSPSSESNVGGRTGHGILRIMEHLAFDLDKVRLVCEYTRISN